jgi:photosystem II stability/assembly factor-like uncharacterized protein
VLVDPASRSIDGWPKCGVAMVSFRTSDEGWLSDTCGRLLRSHDGGASWLRDERQEALLLPEARARRPECEKHQFGGPPLGFACALVKLVWLTPSIGIALADDVPFLLRTVDAGRTWARRELPGGTGFFRLERFGNRVWVYGAHLARSDDLGETWQAMPAPMTGTLPVSLGLSVDSRDHGWLTSLSGSLWETIDGGESWKQIGSGVFHGEILLLAGSHGFVVGPAPLIYETEGGGKTWRALRRPPEDDWHPVPKRLSPERLSVVVEAAGSPVAGLPLLDHRLVVIDDERVAHTGRWLTFFRSGQLVRRGPPLGPGSKDRVPLEGSASATGPSRLGWSRAALFRSEDRGRTWFRVGDLPEPVATMRGLQDGVFVARGRNGGLYRTESINAGWTLSQSALDSHLVEPLAANETSTEGNLAELGDLACLASGVPSSLTLEFGETGYGDSRPEEQRFQLLRVSQGQGAFSLDGKVYTSEEGPLRVIPKRAITTAQATAIRTGILTALRQPALSKCHVSDLDTVATLRVRCHGTESEVARTLVAPGNHAICAVAGLPNSELQPKTRAAFYDPAMGLGEFAREVLAEAEHGGQGK